MTKSKKNKKRYSSIDEVVTEVAGTDCDEGGCLKGGLPTNYRFNKEDESSPYCVMTSKCKYKLQDDKPINYCGYLIERGYVAKEW